MGSSAGAILQKLLLDKCCDVQICGSCSLIYFFFPNENSICTNVGWISQTILSIGNEKHENWVQMYSFLMLGC